MVSTPSTSADEARLGIWRWTSVPKAASAMNRATSRATMKRRVFVSDRQSTMSAAEGTN
jgi:hypothetical protein